MIEKKTERLLCVCSFRTFEVSKLVIKGTIPAIFIRFETNENTSKRRLLVSWLLPQSDLYGNQHEHT
jgi:hypothetical protein